MPIFPLHSRDTLKATSVPAWKTVVPCVNTFQSKITLFCDSHDRCKRAQTIRFNVNHFENPLTPKMSPSHSVNKIQFPKHTRCTYHCNLLIVLSGDSNYFMGLSLSFFTSQGSPRLGHTGHHDGQSLEKTWWVVFAERHHKCSLAVFG